MRVTVLAEAPCRFDPAHRYELALEVVGTRLRGVIDGDVVLEAEDDSLRGGAVGFVVCEGTITAGPVRVTPV